jgi:predicted N-acetyltransferase YhbS
MMFSERTSTVLNQLPIGNARAVRTMGTEDSSLLHKIGELRLRVWRASGTTVNLPNETVSWCDLVEDSNGLHFAVFREEELVAATRLNIYRNFVEMPGHTWMDALTEYPQEPFGVIGRLVVSPSIQHSGLGKFLDRECLYEAAKMGCASLLCDVPTYRVASLERMGFRQIQSPKFGVKLPEIAWTVMYIDLKDNKTMESPRLSARSSKRYGA